MVELLDDEAISVDKLMAKWPETIEGILKHSKLEKRRQSISTMSLLLDYQSSEHRKTEGIICHVFGYQSVYLD